MVPLPYLSKRIHPSRKLINLMNSSLFLILAAFLCFSPSWLRSAPVTTHYILVVGGAGFIGSHINEMLYRQGYQTIVLDNLSLGNQDVVKHGIFIKGDIADSELLDQLFTQYKIDAVMHFAAFKDVGESVKEPLKYYQNNVTNTLNLLAAMVRHQVKAFIFSSSASVYGMPHEGIVTEEHPCSPINPYGQTKLIVEKILKDFDQAYHLRSCSLRYFNAAGGDPKGIIKNRTKDSNLIPIILRTIGYPDQAVTIFGTDYPTPDGTCIRDYIHIEDLGTAHIAAMSKLLNGAPSSCYNLGNGKGFSVREVIAAVEKVTGEKINVKEGARRPGDPSMLVASSSKAFEELGWKPAYTSLEDIIEHAWNAMKP